MFITYIYVGRSYAKYPPTRYAIPIRQTCNTPTNTLGSSLTQYFHATIQYVTKVCSSVDKLLNRLY